MKPYIKLLRYIFAACAIMLSSCQEIFQSFIVENNSNMEIAVWKRAMTAAEDFRKNGTDYMDQVDPQRLTGNELDHFIPAHTTRSVLPAPSGQYWSDFIEENDTVIIYVLEAKMVREAAKRNEKSARSAMLQAYYIPMDDLNSMDFKLSYPPKLNMQYIKMIPAYEDAIAGKTLQDIDLEQED